MKMMPAGKIYSDTPRFLGLRRTAILWEYIAAAPSMGWYGIYMPLSLMMPMHRAAAVRKCIAAYVYQPQHESLPGRTSTMMTYQPKVSLMPLIYIDFCRHFLRIRAIKFQWFALPIHALPLRPTLLRLLYKGRRYFGFSARMMRDDGHLCAFWYFTLLPIYVF